MANFCYKCGKPVRSDALFCAYCGTKLQIEIPSLPIEIPSLPKTGLINYSLPNVTEYDDRYDKSTLKEVIESAKQGDPTALYELAARYRLGVDGVQKNEVQAIKLYKEVLKYQNNRDAFYHIGYMLSNGACGEEHADECIPYYEAALQLKSSRAASQMAIIHEFGGHHVPQNLYKAIEYYNMAIKFGNGNGSEWTDKARAYEKLGDDKQAKKAWEDALKYYDNQIQIVSDEDKAWCWAQKGEIYHHFGNILKAKECYEQALTYGKSALAATQLGIIYEDGIPGKVDVDLNKAYYYYQLGYDTRNNDDMLSIYMLAVFLFNEKAGKDQDFRAFNLFNELRESRVNWGNLYLGFYYGMGIPNHVKVDTKLALQLLEDVQNSDEPQALYYKGLIYLRQLNNQEEGRKYIELAAKKGEKSAIAWLEAMNNDKDAKEIVRKSQSLLDNGNLKDASQTIAQGYQKYPNNLAIIRQAVEIYDIYLIGTAVSGNINSRHKVLCYTVLDFIKRLRADSYKVERLSFTESNVYYCLGVIFREENDYDMALKMLSHSNFDDTPDAAVEIFTVHSADVERYINELYQDTINLRQALNSKNWHTDLSKAAAYCALSLLYSNGGPGIKLDIDYAYDCALRSYELNQNLVAGQLKKFKKNLFGKITYTP